MSIYRKISEESLRKYGTEADKILKIIINQYSDRTHFIYEILQNAEDAGATKIHFELRKNELRIIHNGRPFNEQDIEGVCGIANGTKEDGTRIGHFGIGFKSVYCYTETPFIYSGEHHFVIRNHLFPEEIAEMDDLSYDETCLILPFNKVDVPISTAFHEIREALRRKITAESILMLDHIATISYEIEGDANQVKIITEKNALDKDEYKDKVFGLSIYTTKSNPFVEHSSMDIESDYLFFTDGEKDAVALIFKVKGKELKPVKNSKVFAFFPTAKESHQNFYIHAPFDTTPARDNFRNGSEYGKHNISLTKALGKLLRLSFRWMRDHQYLTPLGFNTVFPIYEYEKDDILYGLYQESIDIIRTEAILPVNQTGEYKRIDEICMPLYGVIADTFDDADLCSLTGKRNASWLAKDFATENYRGFREFLNKHFDIKTLDWKDLVLKMDALFLGRKSLTWMAALMSRIEGYCIRRDTNSGRYIDAFRIPFVRTTDGKQIFARDSSGKLQVYLNNPESAKFRIESSFLQNSSIYNFYSRVLEIPEYNIVQETLNHILPKYETDQVCFETTEPFLENINDLKIIKGAVYTQSLLIEKVKNAYIVTDGKNWYRPTDLYIRSNDTKAGYALIEGIIPIRYLSEHYFDVLYMSLDIDEDFFKRIGCQYGIRTISTPKEVYLKAIKEYIGSQAEENLRRSIFHKTYISNKFNWSFNFEGFPEILSHMTKTRSLAIARFLNPNALHFDIQGELVGADDRNFSGKNVDSIMTYSMIGLILGFEKWIYIVGDTQPHRPIDIDQEDILPEYRPFKRILSILPFREGKSLLTQWLSSSIENQSDIDLVKHYLASPEKMVEMAKMMAKNEARENAKKAKSKSVRELIEEGDRTQREPGQSDGTLELSPISEKAIQKRTQNLDRELAESMDNFTKLAKGLRFGSRTSNQEERFFLEQEYEGHCQICLKQIKKYNGEHYFEAINFIKYSKLPEHFEGTSKYAWNSLCLCPNCAAEYNYASKKISDFYDQVMAIEVEADSEEPIEINIELPMGCKQTIMYSPRHFLALKRALILFSKEP